MELREPRRKPYHNPNINKSSDKKQPILGIFDGFSVTITNTEDVNWLIDFGCFGKGNLSRSKLRFDDSEGKILRRRQMLWRKECSEKFGKSQHRKVIVVPDSDSEKEDIVETISPQFEVDNSGFREVLKLTLCEAYYLLSEKSCLEVLCGNEKLSHEKCFLEFCKCEKYFQQDYLCYNHFRQKNWVVKPGLKFGGDFLLYKSGPAHFHASYLVIIDVISSDGTRRIKELTRRSMCPRNLTGLNRLCETAGKDLLIFQILYPNDFKLTSSEDLWQLRTKEILFRRWVPSAERLKPQNTTNKCIYK